MTVWANGKMCHEVVFKSALLRLRETRILGVVSRDVPTNYPWVSEDGSFVVVFNLSSKNTMILFLSGADE